MSVEPGKWGVIYNPKAGTRKVQKRWKEIKAYMDSKGVSYDYVQSEGFGSVERLPYYCCRGGSRRSERYHKRHYVLTCRRQEGNSHRHHP